MPKIYKKYYARRPNKDKYSVENISTQVTVQPAVPVTLEIVPASTTQGVRKIRHLILSGGSTASDCVCLWALVYVPEGTQPNALQISAVPGSLYEPNQFVMASGIWDSDGGPLRIRSAVSRNLNSGDRVCLLIGSLNANAVPLSLLTTYAIAYN